MIASMPSSSPSSSSHMIPGQRITASVILVHSTLDLSQGVDGQLVQVRHVLVSLPQVVAVAGELVEDDEEEAGPHSC